MNEYATNPARSGPAGGWNGVLSGRRRDGRIAPVGVRPLIAGEGRRRADSCRAWPGVIGPWGLASAARIMGRAPRQLAAVVRRNVRSSVRSSCGDRRIGWRCRHAKLTVSIRRRRRAGASSWRTAALGRRSGAHGGTALARDARRRHADGAGVAGGARGLEGT
jgi:hypothetical protein